MSGNPVWYLVRVQLLYSSQIKMDSVHKRFKYTLVGLSGIKNASSMS